LTAFLGVVINRLGVYDVVIPQIKVLLEQAEGDKVIDLCSGGGGPWERLASSLEKEVGRPIHVLLTDKYPNCDSLAKIGTDSKTKIEFVAESVDATEVPKHLGGIRTLFSSFHHFRPPVARHILTDAAKKGAPIGVFEFTERTILGTLGMLFAPFLALIMVPFFRPFSIKRLLWCVPFPFLPLMITWDGLVSNLRSYTTKELDELVSEIDAPDYHWESGRIWQGLIKPPVTFLIGYPIQKDSSRHEN